MTRQIKICGLSTPETLDAALDAGADLVGLNFFEPSPRYVSLADAERLAGIARGRTMIVALMVDPDDATVNTIVSQIRPDMIQLHGQETPDRVADLRERHDVAVMKAIGTSERDDLERAAAYESVVDYILLDAKPPKGSILPGGNGLAFDWSVLEGFRSSRPWFLSGGLRVDTVGGARGLMNNPGFAGVDVSSGVEVGRGIKDPDKIRAFVSAARQAFQEPERTPEVSEAR